MRIYIATCRGIEKEISDDRVLVGKSIIGEVPSLVMEMEIGAVAVADGVGGNQAGNMAAALACMGLSQMNPPTLQGFQKINSFILALGRETAYQNMGTTLSGIYWYSNKDAILYHVGNSRIYSVQGSGYLRQLTTDDTVVEYLLRTQRLSEEEAASYSGKNEITACFGGNDEKLLKMKIGPLTMKNSSHFLMTTDGIHDYLSTDAIEDLIAECKYDWLNFVKKLVEKAEEQGSLDDRTAVFVDMEA